MIQFLKLQYQMGNIDGDYLDNLVVIGRITEEEKDMILDDVTDKSYVWSIKVTNGIPSINIKEQE